MDSRRALQNIYLETRVIRYDKPVRMLRDLQCFQNRVRLERETGFRYGREICHTRQVANIKPATKDLLKFACLVRVTGREQKLVHHSK